MNIFALSDNARVAAQCHLDKHVVKMVSETVQLLSTAHRLLDGCEVWLDLPNSKKQKLNVLPGESWSLSATTTTEDGTFFTNGTQQKKYKTQKFRIDNPSCWNATHINHPSAVWARSSDSNYQWLFTLLDELQQEYTYRYGRVHKSWIDTNGFLCKTPKNISEGRQTPFPQAMPEEYKNEDSIIAYQNYYVGSKSAIAKWTKREVPTWFSDNYKDYDATNFAR